MDGESFLNRTENISRIITNLKISVKIPIADLQEYKQLVVRLKENKGFKKKYRNFVIIKSDYCYILFCNGHINITGIKTMTEIDWVLFEVGQIFGHYPIGSPNYAIDNISASYNMGISFNLAHLSYFSNLHNISLLLGEDGNKLENGTKKRMIGMFYEPELFPAVKLSTQKGTCLIFTSGKVNFVGVKSSEGLQWLFNQLVTIKNMYENFKNNIHKLLTDESRKLYLEILVDSNMQIADISNNEYDLLDFLF
jgi:TATA-box binding protein (TBP) (component of TFIID and TFIIIB)